MSAPPGNERRPREATEGDAKITGERSDSIVPQTTDIATLARRTGHVVRVVSTLANGRTRSYHFASLDAALKAVDRAEARGCTAVLALCKVVPVSPDDFDEFIDCDEHTAPVGVA